MPIRSAAARTSSVSADPRRYSAAFRLDEPTLSVNSRIVRSLAIDRCPSLSVRAGRQGSPTVASWQRSVVASAAGGTRHVAVACIDPPHGYRSPSLATRRSARGTHEGVFFGYPVYRHPRPPGSGELAAGGCEGAVWRAGHGGNAALQMAG